MDLRSQSILLAALVTSALAIAAFLRPRREVWILYAVTCATLCGMYVSEFLHLVAGVSFWGRLALVFACVVPAASIAFYGEFLGLRAWSAKRVQIYGLLSVAAGVVAAFSPLAEARATKIAIAAWVFGGLAYALSLLLRQRAKSASPTERARLAYLGVGAAIAIVASGLDTLLWLGIEVPPLGPLLTPFYLWLLALTLQRRRLLDLHELLGKIAALSVQAILLAALYFLLVWWVAGTFSLFVFNLLVASVVALILVEPFRAKLDQTVIAALFRERGEMLRTLATLKARLATVIDVRAMAALMMETFRESRRVTHASLYLMSEDKPGFWLVDSIGPTPNASLSAAGARSLIPYALAGRKAVLLENLERRVAELRHLDSESRRVREEAKKLGDLKAALRQMQAGITLPLFSGARVIGFLNLWDDRVPEAYASDEIAAMIQIAERVSTIVENSALYERLRERDRLAALGEMAAGLAHEIRNPLGAIKGAAQMLSPRPRMGEEGELLAVIVEEVDRLNSVVTNFLDYSRPLKQSFAPTDLVEVVARTVKLLGAELPPRIEFEAFAGDRLPKVLADAEQLRQVLINLIQNAVQAMPTGGKLTLSILRPEELLPWRLSASPEVIELRVRDTGVGFDDTAGSHLFVPFFTTKEKGTGLGLAICQRIVTSHGGYITASSKPGEGTEFVIRLPAIPGSRPPEPAGEPTGTPIPDLTPFPGSFRVDDLRRLDLLPKRTPPIKDAS